MPVSVLRSFFPRMREWEAMNPLPPLDQCKQEAIAFIQGAPFKKKGRAPLNKQEMIEKVQQQTSVLNLISYLGWSLLALEMPAIK